MFHDMSDEQLMEFLASRFVSLPGTCGRGDLLEAVRANGLHWGQPRDPTQPLGSLERNRALLSVARELKHSLALLTTPHAAVGLN